LPRYLPAGIPDSPVSLSDNILSYTYLAHSACPGRNQSFC
jgi:hypothetical protein